jgi:transcription elongation factor Elf1
MEQPVETPKTFPCPGCGAQLQWDPTSGVAFCQFCGYKQDVQQPQAQGRAAQAAAVQEHDLMSFIRQSSMQKPTGYGTATKTVTCKSCGASVSVEPHIASTECAFCGSTMVFEQAANEALIRPESLLPLAVDRTNALRTYKTWLSKGWFHPGDLKARAGQAKLYGVYLPFWTFDANVHSDWRAMAGTYYHVTESYWTTEGGKQVHRTRQVRKVRWQPASGHHDAFYDDVLIQASLSVETKMLERIYPYDTTKLVPYDPRYLSGWEAEQYRIDLQQGWNGGREKMHGMEVAACDRLVPGDTHKDLSVSSTFADITFKHVLLPLWISSYKYKTKVFRFLVNGQTGKIYGEKPLSAAKIALTVIAGLILLGLVIGLVCFFTQ